MRRPWIRRPLFALALLVLAPACLKVPVELAEDPSARAAPSTAAEVLTRHIRAIGGEDELRSLAQRTVEARLVMRPEEGCPEDDETCVTEEQTGTFLLRSTADGKMYRRTVFDDVMEERGFDGTQGWRLQAGALTLEDEAEAARSREDAVLHWYFDLEDRGVEATLERPRDEDFDQKTRTLDGLRWEISGADVPAKTLWFDRKTGLLQEEVIEEVVGDDRLVQTITYSDYRDVDGVLVPHRIRLIQQLGARSQEVVFITQRTDHEPIDPDLFAVPNVPPPEPAADERLAKLASARADAERQPRDARAAMALARAAWAAARFDEAMTAARATLALDAREPEALFILARAHLLRGELRRASRALTRAARAGVKDAAIAVQRAWIHSRTNDFAKLADALAEAGDPAMSGRYRSFAGEPLKVRMRGSACATTVELAVRQPLVAVPLTVGGQDVLALLDTGAADVILDEELAIALGIPIQTRTAIGESTSIGRGQIPELAIGDATVKNVPMDTLPRQSVKEMVGAVGAEVRAVLGTRLLARFQTTLDVQRGTLELVERAPRCAKELRARRTGASAPFYVHETHYLYMHASMNDAEGLYLVNTGMRGAAVAGNTSAYAHAAVGPPPMRRGETPLVTVPTFAITDGVRFENVVGAYGVPEQTETSDGFRLDGMLGLDLLSTRRWTIDFDEQKLYFGDGTAPAAGS
jgi:hypothetical protein